MCVCVFVGEGGSWNLITSHYHLICSSLPSFTVKLVPGKGVTNHPRKLTLEP